MKKELARYFSKETQMTNCYMGKDSTSQTIREIQMKSTIKYFLTPTS